MLGLKARAGLLSLVYRLITGRRLPSMRAEEMRQVLANSGFRAAARYFLVRSWFVPPGGDAAAVVVCPALDGRFQLAVASDDIQVGSLILEQGTFEPPLVAYYQRTLRAGMTVVDVGANIGFHALHAATLVGPEGRVVAIEPDPTNAALLRQSLRLAGGSLSVDIMEAALSDRPGELILSDLGNRANSGARFTHSDRGVLESLVHGPAPSYTTVAAVTWDDSRPDIHPDLVKIDVEGFEQRAMSGMERMLERDRPVVLSEFAPSNLKLLGGIEPESYLDWFRQRGYTPAILEEDGGTRPAGTNAEVLGALGRLHHLDLVFTTSAGC